MPRGATIEREVQSAAAPLRATGSSKQQLLAAAIGCGVALWVWAGWRLFWFLTDDAHITFRYVRNLVDGYGPVWNRAPFMPVEGYSSPLWMLLLAAIWRGLGVPPTQSANVIGLWCGYASVLVLWAWMRRLQLPAAVAQRRWQLFAIPIAAVLLNRHFYTWLSSGLETPLFNLCALAWVWLGLFSEAERDRRWAVRFAWCCSAITLTRPDGLLFMALGVPQLAWALRRERPVRALLLCWPLALVAAHLLFRRAYYGEWLPNTYYAKYVAPWPEAGVRYAGSFLIENALWVWLLLVPLWAAKELAQRWRARRWPSFGRSLTLLGVIGHIAYYTLLIGGDHFEYRVYSSWLPLAFLSCVPLLARLTERVGVIAAACALIAALSLPIPWKHWQDTHLRVRRDDTRTLWVPLADDFQQPMRGLVQLWDDWQTWLVKRAICVRHQEHKVFVWFATAFLPPPAARPPLRWADRPVVIEGSVGVVGWQLPEVAVIDALGLNDYVIARTPVSADRRRRMAHDRAAPPGYLACFKSNVSLPQQGVMDYRPRVLSDARIRDCEQRFRAQLPQPAH